MVKEGIERSSIMQKFIALRRCLDEVVLYTELLEYLGVIWRSVGQVGLFKWQLGI